RFFIDRIKIRVAVTFVEHRNRREEPGYHLLLYYGMTEFGHSRLGIVHGQDRDSLKPRVDFAVTIIEPVIVRPRNDASPIGILNQAKGKSCRWIEDGSVQF